MDLGIKDRLALVTGASRGIGRAIAAGLAGEGARLILVARSAEQLERACEEISTPDRQHRALAIDLMSEGGVQQLIKNVKDEFGSPDIMVHNLGGSFGLPGFASVSEWQKVWYFNVGIGHELNDAFIPTMVENAWGRIVHLSTLSTRTYGGSPPYVSAKCALDGYVKSMNRQVSKHNVIMTAVAPGAIYSEGRYFAKLQDENRPELEKYFDNFLPIRRLGTGEDIAPVVAFLCSEYAAFMAGSIVSVDGGA